MNACEKFIVYIDNMDNKDNIAILPILSDQNKSSKVTSSIVTESTTPNNDKTKPSLAFLIILCADI